MPRKFRGATSKTITRAARINRGEPTPAEKILWEVLRGSKVCGMKFRRQHPYKRYVLDYYCIEQMLAIEVDGGVHGLPEQKEYDCERTLCLAENGIRVLRFTNDEVTHHLDAVIHKIISFVRAHPLVGIPSPGSRFAPTHKKVEPHKRPGEGDGG